MRVRARGEDVRCYIVENVEKHPTDICRVAAEKFAITRQAVNKHLQKLVLGVFVEAGKTRSRASKLVPLAVWRRKYEITPELAEDVVWRNDIAPVLGKIPENVMEIWHYAFTEMFNNAIDHSGGTLINVQITKTAANAVMEIYDNGIGIFKKIQTALDYSTNTTQFLNYPRENLPPIQNAIAGRAFSSRREWWINLAFCQGMFF